MPPRRLQLSNHADFTAAKACSRCGEVKSTVEFNKRARSLDGHQPWCKRCFSNYQREQKYGLSIAEIAALLARGCEVCLTSDNLVIDHDHETGEVRGCLCDWCNRALGLLRDDLANVLALAAYRARSN